jgi:hypothetical protein
MKLTTKDIFFMKTFLRTLFAGLALSTAAHAQNVAINSTGAAPNSSAMLDISSANSGLLIPRVALSALNNNSPIGASITTSLLVYNTATAGTAPNAVTPGYYYWDGAKWVRQVDQVVERWYVSPATYTPGTYGLTITVPGITTTSSVFVNLVGTWGATPNVQIQHVEAQTGQIRFRMVVGGTGYAGMDFMVTVVR